MSPQALPTRRFRAVPRSTGTISIFVMHIDRCLRDYCAGNENRGVARENQCLASKISLAGGTFTALQFCWLLETVKV
jgi:hypothetical protein